MPIENIVRAGRELTKESRVLILLHGRGGSAEDILSLADYLAVEGFSLLAPQARNNSWYPHSFLAPPVQNEPWLSFSLQLVKDLVDEVRGAGVPSQHIYFTGFSQGACLTLEFAARHADHYGGVAAFTGGLIGDKIYTENYRGDFKGTPVFIGTGNPDPYVPVERVYATATILKKMDADVTEKVYDHIGHTVNRDEMEMANELVFRRATVER